MYIVLPDNYHPVQATDNGCHSDQETFGLMKESTQNDRIWQEPSAPPPEAEVADPEDQRPPSYCSTPPEYRPLFLTVNNLLLKKRCEIKGLESMYLIIAPTLKFVQ